ncbi:MAG TPA: GLPGLI family protein [Puia sp.]|nr:GLPGLI family protein [Puia sp.]
MKKILLAAFFLPLLQSVRGQATGQTAGQGSTQAAGQPAAPASVSGVVLKEGKVIYDRKVNLRRRIKDENMKAMLPEFNTSRNELDFSGDESVYRNVAEAEDIRDKAGEENNGMVIRFNNGGANDQTYKNYAADKSLEQREMGPHKYLIEDTLRKINWKLESAETRTMLGYACKKATMTGRDGMTVVAWYAEDIVSSSGPESFGGLPGLILELNMNDAEIVFTAREIVGKGFDKSIVKAPTEGKKITRAAFQKMMEEQFGEGGGKQMIRIMADH